jgi:LPXTG-site transpeptidase (sortase) family protein
VDYAATIPYARVNYRGPGAFRNLELLAAGDTVTVRVGGRTLEYTVLWRTREPGSGGDWERIMAKHVEGDAITLVTCGGDFNFQTLEYSHRVVVRAVRS